MAPIKECRYVCNLLYQIPFNKSIVIISFEFTRLYSYVCFMSKITRENLQKSVFIQNLNILIYNLKYSKRDCGFYKAPVKLWQYTFCTW